MKGRMSDAFFYKEGHEFTNPEIRIIFVILSKVPKCALSWESPLIMQSLAAFWADSIDCSAGTFPQNITFPSFIGI